MLLASHVSMQTPMGMLETNKQRARANESYISQKMLELNNLGRELRRKIWKHITANLIFTFSPLCLHCYYSLFSKLAVCKSNRVDKYNVFFIVNFEREHFDTKRVSCVMYLLQICIEASADGEKILSNIGDNAWGPEMPTQDAIVCVLQFSTEILSQ